LIRRGGGCDDDLDLVVVDGEGGDGCTVSPDRVVDGPVAGIGFPGEERVVADDVAGDFLDAFGGDLVGELGDIAKGIGWGRGWLLLPLCGRQVGKSAAGEVGVAAADEGKVAGDGSRLPTMRVSKVAAGPSRAMAAEVVKSLVLEAGWKSWAWLRE
jgi:hypothetical protein